MEMPQGFLAGQGADAAFNTMDMDGDGRISKEEFAKFRMQQLSGGQQPRVNEVDVRFEPGTLGVDGDDIGRVVQVHPGQAQFKGILPGWIFRKVDGNPYSEALLDSRINGRNPYTITFSTELAQQPAPHPTPPMGMQQPPQEVPVASWQSMPPPSTMQFSQQQPPQTMPPPSTMQFSEQPPWQSMPPPSTMQFSEQPQGMRPRQNTGMRLLPPPSSMQGLGQAPPATLPFSAAQAPPSMGCLAAPPSVLMGSRHPQFDIPSKGPNNTWMGDDELTTEAKSMKDIRRAFALAGPLLLFILALLPAWGALALLRSRTYLYFSVAGSSVAGMILGLVVLIALWTYWLMGVPMVYMCPVPNPFRAFSGCFKKLSTIPLEAWVMLFLTIFLLAVWKLIPLFQFGGIHAVLNSVHSFCHVADMMWFSHNAAAHILSAAVGSILLYLISLNYYFARAKPEVRDRAPSLFAIWGVFVFVMGASFMLGSMPIAYEAETAYDELLSSCETGGRTRDLYTTSQALQSLRQTPGCLEHATIEDCGGFVTTVYSQVLKSMETDLKCSGFCYNPAGITPLSTGSVPTISNYTDYPPTLFTKANFEASCDGMAARTMRNFVGATGSQILHQGMMLVLIAVALVALRLVGVCIKHQEDNEFAPIAGSYGATITT